MSQLTFVAVVRSTACPSHFKLPLIVQDVLQAAPRGRTRGCFVGNVGFSRPTATVEPAVLPNSTAVQASFEMPDSLSGVLIDVYADGDTAIVA